MSHQWLGFAHPDPRGEQFQHLRRTLLSLVEGKYGNVGGQGTRVRASRWQAALPGMFVWFDYWSIPQPRASSQQLTGQAHHSLGESEEEAVRNLQCAVRSIPAYVERAALFLVLTPICEHADTGEPCTAATWRWRGWCRQTDVGSHHRWPWHDLADSGGLISTRRGERPPRVGRGSKGE